MRGRAWTILVHTDRRIGGNWTVASGPDSHGLLAEIDGGRWSLQLTPATGMRAKAAGEAATVELGLAQLQGILDQLAQAQADLQGLHRSTHGLHREGPVALCPVCTP